MIKKLTLSIALLCMMFLAVSCFSVRCEEPSIIDKSGKNCCSDLNKNGVCDNTEDPLIFPGEKTDTEGETQNDLNSVKEANTDDDTDTISDKEQNLDEEETKMEESKTNNPIVNIKTNMGNIKLELFEDKAPITVKNFLRYVKDSFYDGTIFHRVIDGFMIQGGGFEPDGTQKDTYAEIKLESNNGLKNNKGTIAMARTNIPDSATSQFFINLVDNNFLNYAPGNDGYTVFGKVISGMDIVEKIGKVKTSSTPMADWPVEDVVIEKVTLE